MDTTGVATLFENDDEEKNLTSRLISENKLISPWLNKLEFNYIKAHQGKKLCLVSRRVAVRKLLPFILKAFAYRNEQIKGYDRAARYEALSVLTRMTYDDLMDCYPYVTIEEIELAISNGCRQAYGKVYSINLMTLNGFVASFLKDQDRTNAFVKQKRFLDSITEKPKEKMTPEKLDEIGNSCLCTCFENYKNLHFFFDGGKLAYDYAIRTGKFSLNNKEKTAIYEQAIEEVEQEEAKENILFGRNRFQRRSEEDLQLLYKSKAMDISLRRYFDFNIYLEKGLCDHSVTFARPIEEQLKKG